MSSSDKNKSSGGTVESHKNCDKYDPTIFSSSSSPIKRPVSSPIETTPERRKLKWNDYEIEPTLVPFTTIHACTSDGDLEVLVFGSSTSSSRSNDNVEASLTSTSSNNDIISSSNRSSAINASIEEFQRTLSYLKNKIGLPGAESTPNVDVIGNKTVNIQEATSSEPSTSKQNSDMINISVINESLISNDSELSPFEESLSTKPSSILKQSLLIKQSSQTSPFHSKVTKMQITTQKVEPRTVELTLSLPVNVNCEALIQNDNKLPAAVQTETQFKYESKKKLHQEKVSEGSPSSFKCLRMDSALKHSDPPKIEAKTTKIIACPAFSEEEKKSPPSKQVQESDDSSITEQIDKNLKKLHDILKTKKIKSKTKRKYMKSLLKEISKVELSDGSNTASDPEIKDSSKNISPTKSKCQKYLKVLEQKLVSKKDANEVESKVPTTYYAKEKTLRCEDTKRLRIKIDDAAPKISSSKATYVLASSDSNRSLEKESDYLLKFSENERNYQLGWIKTEINHLCKLKEKLEIKNTKSSKKRTETNVYNVAKTDGSSERTYIINTKVDVPVDENINNYIFDGQEYVVSHSHKLSSDSDQAIAAEIIQCDGMGTFCKQCKRIVCTCPSKTTLQSKLSSLCTESNSCLNCHQLFCICQEKMDDSAGPPLHSCCICQNKVAIARNSSARILSNECIHVEVKQPVASKKESRESLSFLDCVPSNDEYYCLCKDPSTTEGVKDKNLPSSRSSTSFKERSLLAVESTPQKTRQTGTTDPLSYAKDSNEALTDKVVNIVLAKLADKKNTSAEKSSSTHANNISNVSLQTSKDVLCKNHQIETDESLSTRAQRDSLTLEENVSNVPSKARKISRGKKSSSIKPQDKLDNMLKHHKHRHSFTGNLEKDLASLLLLTDQDLNSLAEISEFENDAAESGLPSLKDNPSYSGRLGFENISDRQSKRHISTQTQTNVVTTGATQTYINDDNTGDCVCLKYCCGVNNVPILPKINEDFKNDLAKMLKELKEVKDDAWEQSPETREKSPGKSPAVHEIVPLADPNRTYRDIGVQVYPNLFPATAQTSVEKLMKDEHANTESNKYEESSVQTSPGYHLPSARHFDKLKKDKSENTDLQVIGSIKDPKIYSDIAVQVSPRFYVPTIQNLDKLKKDKNENTNLKVTVNKGVQASPSFRTAEAQTSDKAQKNKSVNTDLEYAEPSKDPKTYRDIDVQVSPSFHSPTNQNLDKLKKDKNENTNTSPLTKPKTYRNLGVQASRISHTASSQTEAEVKENKNQSTHINDASPLKDPKAYRDFDVQASPSSRIASAQTVDKLKENKNESANFTDAPPSKDPNIYRDFGVQVSPSFHTPIDQPSVQKLYMDEFESTDAEHKNSSIVTKCKKCEHKKKHRQSKKSTSDSATTIISLSDSTASSRITCSCCKHKAYLSEVNYMRNGNTVWAVCNRCFYNRRAYCGYNCRSVCQCWSYWLNTSRIHYRQCCKMDISTSTNKVQGVAYTVTLLNNDAAKLQGRSISSLEDVIKVQKGWTPSHLKYLKNEDNSDRRLTENNETKAKKEKSRNKKISKTDQNKYVENNYEMRQGKSKNTSKTDINVKNKETISKNTTANADAENGNTTNEDENIENEDQDESSEVQSVQHTLMDYLVENRPEFVSTAEYRRQMLLKSKKSREELREAKKLNFLKKNLEKPNKGKFKLFTEQEMRNINKKNYHKLPEVRGKILNQRENELRHADRLMSYMLAKKIQKSVLTGKGQFPIDQSLTNL